MGQSHKGVLSYIDRLEWDYLGYISVLYRYAARTLGARASFTIIAICTNKKSRVDPDCSYVLDLLRRALNTRFAQNGSHEVSFIEKPFDTDAHKN